ncbi:hypothetical protein MAR_010787 [Mya arenaria]|uniref:Uncharacterized protein n=1 Tax=Mya arenaria TaxID=6604 RepID=A0ABY7FS80_MYAAR|nr:hypothetical protein MAR_010787 [Mya arenaria]
MFRMHKREALRRVDESAEEGDIVTHTENYQDKRHHNSQTITRSQEPYSCARSSRPNQNGMRKGRTLVSNTNIRQDPVQTHVLHGIEETKNYALHRDSMPKNANDVPRDTKPTEPNQNENVIEVFIRESIRSEIVRAKPAEYKCFDAVVVYDSRDYDYSKISKKIQNAPGIFSIAKLDWFDRESPFTREKVITVLKEAVVVRKRKEIDANVKRNFKYAHELQKKLDLSS